jgi:arabinogalactan endo-1,4-beta-galactosidase
MAIPDGVQYSNKRVLTLTWTDQDGNAIDLTNATLMGAIYRAGGADLITGALAVTSASAGIFTWTPSAADVAEAGTFFVQFYARYSNDSSTPEISPRHRWLVTPSFAFPFVSPSLSPSASVSPSASASPSS